MISGYRAWLLKEKKMVGVLDILLRGDGIIQTECEDSNYDGLSKVVGRDCVLMRSTGQKDQDGKGREIYEGDIIAMSFETKCRGVVTYTPSCSRFDVKGGLDFIWEGGLGCYGRIIVIGNIYENPELLVR